MKKSKNRSKFVNQWSPTPLIALIGVLTIHLCFFLTVSVAHGGELVGKKILPTYYLQSVELSDHEEVSKSKVITRPGSIPNFIEVRGGSLDTGFFLRSGYLERKPIFLITRIYPDNSQDILHIKELALNGLDTFLTKDNYLIRNSNGYQLSDTCTIKTPSRISGRIIGLAKPKMQSCRRDTNLVSKAWMYDVKNNNLAEISVNGITCSITTMSDC